MRRYIHAWMEKEKKGEARTTCGGRAVTPRFIRAGAMKKLHACSMQGGHGHHDHTHGHADAAC